MDGPMNKLERERIITEALEWMQEDGGRFPGWVVDLRIDRALLESAVFMCPQIQLIPTLAALRAHWFERGEASAKIWRKRFRRWLDFGLRRGDPLIVGPAAPGPGSPGLGD